MSDNETKSEEKAARKAGPPVLTIAALAIALAAIGFSAFLFIQLKAGKAEGSEHGEEPAGLQPEDAHGEGDAHGNALAVHEESEEVVYELGEFTANTSDGKYTKMTISLVLDSFYTSEAWDAYQSDLRLYDEKLKMYYEFKSGKVDAEGKPLGDHAMAAAEVVVAAHGAPKEPEPPKMPESVQRPMTLLEIELERQNAMVRDVIIRQINEHSSAELTTPVGIDDFKKKVIDTLNGAVEPHLGTVKDLYFKDRVTT